ncbi:MAG: 4-hydroxy-3-methylbut-2-enyl diphosphate reductase [Bacteroidia bacterium]|nr:4-hydroxy-3-methylbut-2-enyl diphosphate reductase [Bacteroidia bacterium]
MKNFNVPEFYRSPLIHKVRQFQKERDPKRKDTLPALLRLDDLEFILPRHFGFCYGVENAIDIAFSAVEENKGKRVFLLSQMIHNPGVNQDLQNHGVRFLQDTDGKPLFNLDELVSEDVVIIPAFGAPVQTLEKLKNKGVDILKYNTTCPFVERVWKKAEQIGKSDCTIVVHGKYSHEETRSTFSRVVQYAPAAIIVLNMEEAQRLEPYIMLQKSQEEFESEFKGKFSKGFDIHRHFQKLGVVNQTTMLASETQEIADYFRRLMIKKFGESEILSHFSDTRDTLCYATHENQEATLQLLNVQADMAIVAGGYNSSNTTHLAELLEKKFPVYFVADSQSIHNDYIECFDLGKQGIIQKPWNSRSVKRIIITGGASCPDALLDRIIHKIWQIRGNPTMPEPFIGLA